MIDIVIIGAGMPGIACARALRAAGAPVRMIDKGRGIGGREKRQWNNILSWCIVC